VLLAMEQADKEYQSSNAVGKSLRGPWRRLGRAGSFLGNECHLSERRPTSTLAADLD
jgi:hypothetical protein